MLYYNASYTKNRNCLLMWLQTFFNDRTLSCVLQAAQSGQYHTANAPDQELDLIQLLLGSNANGML